MKAIGIALERRGRCPCLGFYEKKLVSNKYDFDLWGCRSEGLEELSATDLRVMLGKQIIAQLPAHFRLENKGQFIAVTYTGKVLAVCNSLEALNGKIAQMHPKENYYIERLGHPTIAQI